MLDLQEISAHGDRTGGIFGAECALGLQGLCSYPAEEFPILLTSYPKRIAMVPIANHPWINKPTKEELIQIEGDYYMTTPERSIIDLLRVYPESEFIAQAIVRMDDLTKLRQMADKYGVREQLEE